MNPLQLHLVAVGMLAALFALFLLLGGCDLHGTCGSDNRDPLCHQSW